MQSLEAEAGFCGPAVGNQRVRSGPRETTGTAPAVESTRRRTQGDGHKEGNKMEVMDLAMIATLVVSFVLVKLLADWCDRQMDK